MHRHAYPLCIGHLALFQCHRGIYISKGEDQEGSLCALFLTLEMIWFISSSTEIYAFRGPSRLSYPKRDGRGRSKKRDLWFPRVIPDPTNHCHSSWFMWCGWLSLCSQAQCVMAQGGDGTIQSKGACVPEVSDSHVWRSMTGLLRSNWKTFMVVGIKSYLLHQGKTLVFVQEGGSLYEGQGG